jgi:DNA-binding HxlR family transcriptional regulator
MRRSKENDLLELLGFRRKGYTWKELLGKHVWTTSMVFTGEIQRGETNFPRQTLARHLRTLIKKGIVEKVQEPRKDGERGRPSSRYRIKSDLCQYVRWPCKWIGPRFFLGDKTTNPHHVGRKIVRLWSEEAREYEECKKSLGKAS